MLTFPLAGYRSCAVFLLPDLDSQRACRLHDITALPIRPDVAHCLAGGVNSADRLNLVIESIRSDTHRGAATYSSCSRRRRRRVAYRLAPTWFYTLLGNRRR